MDGFKKHAHHLYIFLAMAAMFTISSVSVIAAAALPAHENCKSATYISPQWNDNTKKSNKNKALAYKKLICKSGREAFILVQADKSTFSYWLIDHYERKISKKANNVCAIVNKYCTR